MSGDPVLARALAGEGALREDLARLVACVSVGADPASAAGMEAARRLIEERLRRAGFANVGRLDAGSGQPAVVAEWLGAPGRPTLLVYGHYDVQPPEPLALWHSPPFVLEERDGRLYGRGASDDKGPLLIALDALGAFLAEEGRLPVNVRVLIEGEEETRSPSLAAILDHHRARLAADAVLSADGARWRPDLVSVNVGSRGNAGLEIRVRTAAKDLHSGRYGGVVPNALHVLAGLVAGLHDARGRVAVAGFYEGVSEPSAAERAALREVPFDETAFLGGVGTVATGEAGFTTLERLWLRPTLDVNGLWGGHAGPGPKTVIPCEAGAKITMRLVPGQDPDRAVAAVAADLRARLPPHATLDVLPGQGGSGACALPQDHPLLLAAATALRETTGREPVRVRIGATLPLTEIVSRVLGIDTVMFSFATADEDFHAPNEFLRVASIGEGLAAWVAVLRAAGRTGPEAWAAFRRRPG